MLAFVAIVSALIPIVITAFELITTDKESVVFLENYNPALAILILSYYALLLILGLIWVVKQLIPQVKSIIRLKNEKTKTELLHLKNQVNPHFFFNMLNNLYGLVGKDPEKAQQLILKLSELMRYSIYDGQEDFVAVSEEVNYLKNYIELNQMRYHKKIDIVFDSQIEEDYKVMPLLFILLLENAFKHGVETLGNNAYVHVKVLATNGKVEFEVENNFDKAARTDELGIGLNNLKRRLELAYKDKHSLSFSITESVYKVQLILDEI